MRIVGGVWGGRTIAAPRGRLTRPTTDRVREAWMSAIAPELPEAIVIDLFAGSGALGIEALSRGAASVTFIESASAALAIIRQNLDKLGAAQTSYRLVRGDALRFVRALPAHAFDIALADPPYAKGLATQLAGVFAATPFTRLLCLEHAPDEELPGEPAWHRQYGDTSLTFLRSDDGDR